MKVFQLHLFLIISAAILPNSAYASKSRHLAASPPRPNGNNDHTLPQMIITKKRGGSITKTQKGEGKKRPIFGMLRVPDMNSKNTKLQIESTTIEGSGSNVDAQYRAALIKTVLTVSSAGK